MNTNHITQEHRKWYSLKCIHTISGPPSLETCYIKPLCYVSIKPLFQDNRFKPVSQCLIHRKSLRHLFVCLMTHLRIFLGDFEILVHKKATKICAKSKYFFGTGMAIWTACPQTLIMRGILDCPYWHHVLTLFSYEYVIQGCANLELRGDKHKPLFLTNIICFCYSFSFTVRQVI